jgi:hypothetical protein
VTQDLSLPHSGLLKTEDDGGSIMIDCV